MNADPDNLWADGDPFDDPATMTMAGTPPRPAKGYGIYTLEWLARALPIVQSADQLAVALVLYRRCVRKRRRTVSFPNGELTGLGISRFTKYRALAELQEAGAVSIETEGRHSLRVTLHWFP